MLVLWVFYLVGWIFNNSYEPSRGCWVPASPGSVTVRQQLVTGTSGCPQSSGHGWGISEGQERLGLPCGNLNCQGVTLGSPASPFSHFPAMLPSPSSGLAGAFTPCPLLQ